MPTLSLGGTSIIDKHGTLVWVERPAFGVPSDYIGRKFWSFQADHHARNSMETAFAMTIALGKQTTGTLRGSEELHSLLFKYRLTRIGESEHHAVCQYALSREAKLTHTEERVLELMMRDFQAAEIAVDLKITTNTVQTHRRAILRKTGCRGVAALSRWHHERLRWLP